MGLPNNSNFNLHSKFPHGQLNLITDVNDVTVGNITIEDQKKNIHTGVTAIKPHGGNLFRDSLMAGASIINGFGKSIGLIQLLELGTIETPILLTNTLSIGTAYTALSRYMLNQNPDIGVDTGTVNCIITECNDGVINDIRGMHVKEEHINQALEKTDTVFEEGNVGAGTGMCCLGLKGGIGSSSRVVKIDGNEFTIGALVLSNFGSPGNLTIGGVHHDTKISENTLTTPNDKGSIIIVIATDIPLSERQLNRVAKRATISLGRTGSFCGNGSGDIAIAFSTSNHVPHYSNKSILNYQMFYDENIDIVFEATVEAVEESIISSLYYATTTYGIRDSKYLGLNDFLYNFKHNENKE